jgi:hypothetical protein
MEKTKNMEIKFKTTKRDSKKYEYQDHTWILDDQLNIEDLLVRPEFTKFEYCASIVNSKSAAGYEIALQDKFKNQGFIIYLVTMGGKILKGGKSKNSLDTRSYTAGTEESWTMRGTPSTTNYVWSQIFRESLRTGQEIKFYGMIVPSYVMTYESFDGKVITESVSPYESEEKKLNKLLNTLNGKKVIGEGKLLTSLKK